MVRDRARPILLGFFLPLRCPTCAELGVGDDTIAAGALDYLRKVRFRGLAGSDPVGAILREIEGVVAGVSRN